jgi:cobalamin biosynthesis protein CobT
LIEHLIGIGRMSAPRANQPPAELLGHAVLLLARHHYRDQAALAAHAQRSEQVLQQVFGARFVRALQALLAEIPQLTSTAETLALAELIMALVEGVSRGEAPQTASSSEAEAGSGDDRQEDGDSHASGENAAEATPDGQAGDAAQAGDSGSGDDRQEDGDSHASGEDAAEATPDGQCDAQGDGQAGGAQPSDSTESSPVSARRSAQEALAAHDDALPEDLIEVIGGLLQAHSDGARSVLPSLETYAGDAWQGQVALRRVKGHSAQLTARLQGLVQSEQLTRTRTVRQGRRLSAAHLHRAGVGDARIFQVRTAHVRPNTALHLLVDLSGSMCSGEDRIALDAAMALALALEPINGVSQAVSVFPGLEGQHTQVTGVLAHGERVAQRAGAFVQSARGGTPMTSALWFAAADLLARPEPRKVLITLTDGEPNQRATALALIAQAERAGIELIGIGIQHSVDHLFPVAIRIDAVNDLKRALFGVAERLFVSNQP